MIVTVWILFFLGVLAIAIAAHVSANLSAASRLKQRTQAHFLARSGVAKAALVLTRDTNQWDSLSESWSEGDAHFLDVRMENGVFRVWYTNRAADGTIVTNYGLIDEERKINISIPLNNEAVLKSLMQVVGRVGSQTASDIAASIMDWKDADNNERPGGAESDYYGGLKPSYKPHNYLFDRLEEVLLIKGVGGPEFSRIRDVVTIYGSGVVNLNTASYDAVLVLAHSRGFGLDVARSLASKILEYRNLGFEFHTSGRAEDMVDDILETMHRHVGLTVAEADVLTGMINAGLASTRSTAFRAFASGRVDGRPVADRVIEFVMQGGDGRVVYWKEN